MSLAVPDACIDDAYQTGFLTIAQAIRDGASLLHPNVDNPRLESRLLLAHALGVSQNELIRNARRPVDVALFNSLLTRRCAHEPLAFIVGRREFWSMDFEVSPATLIPRPDSETLVEAALEAFANRSPPMRVIDLGTGTGCLLLAVLKAFPTAFGIGIDLEYSAVALAKANAVRHELSDRTSFLTGNWTDSISSQFDLIIANPPYVAGSDIENLMPEVACYEPKRALDGGLDGYDAYRAILPDLRHHLDLDGVAILEFGVGQAEYVAKLAQQSGFHGVIRRDLAGIPRAIILAWPNRSKKVWQRRQTGVR